MRINKVTQKSAAKMAAPFKELLKRSLATIVIGGGLVVQTAAADPIQESESDKTDRTFEIASSSNEYEQLSFLERDGIFELSAEEMNEVRGEGWWFAGLARVIPLIPAAHRSLLKVGSPEWAASRELQKASYSALMKRARKKMSYVSYRRWRSNLRRALKDGNVRYANYLMRQPFGG